MKTILFSSIVTLVLTHAASADVRVDDLSAFYLTECGPNQGYVQAPERGPVPPRVLSPQDAATWLPNRAWDVRPLEPCKTKTTSKAEKTEKQVKKRTQGKVKIPVPQK